MNKAVFVFLGMMLCLNQAKAYEPPLRFQPPINLPEATAAHDLRVQAFKLARVSRVDDGKIYLGNLRVMTPKDAARFYSNMGATHAAVLAKKDLKSGGHHRRSSDFFGSNPVCNDPNCGSGLGSSGCGNGSYGGGEAAGAILIVALVAVVAVVVVVAVINAIQRNRDSSLPQASVAAALEYNRFLLNRLNLPGLAADLD